ncbi:unnamed protein product [Bursaphelenchus xylophilus]|uniref:(pine wood nematode) hypothetical protein n=1 Tax=Bursaphelenchus xylophilus TaxID=6326 RepID=A0A1I7S5G7_BURXY|nr:unnamed protein product [Bursaphelenchus xylophilus]CAG9118061.1 unnamed protein product [Bursaphelenchus xylophilus]
MKLRRLDGTVDPWRRFAALVASKPCRPTYGPDFSILPVEILLKIFRNLSVADLGRLCQTCTKFCKIIQNYRLSLEILHIPTIVIQYGKWFDVLTKVKSNEVKLTYQMASDKRLPKVRKPRFLKSDRVAPLKGIIQHSYFDTTYIRFELLHPDMVFDLHLSMISTRTLYLDFSHHSIQKTLLQRYWNTMAQAINDNVNIDVVNIILNPKNNELYGQILRSLPDCSVEAVLAVGCKLSKNFLSDM